MGGSQGEVWWDIQEDWLDKTEVWLGTMEDWLDKTEGGRGEVNSCSSSDHRHHNKAFHTHRHSARNTGRDRGRRGHRVRRGHRDRSRWGRGKWVYPLGRDL